MLSSEKTAGSRSIGVVLVFAAVVSCSLAALPYTGVNLSGAEWTSGPYWTTTQEIDFFASRGMNTIRLPFAWEDIQPTAKGEFDATAWGRYTTLVDYITKTKGLYAVIDVHNYARYNNQIVGKDVSLDTLLDLWTRLANYYRLNDKVIFGMMNEPNTMSTTLWANNAKATVQAIRDTTATNIILVPGNGWTGAWTWNATWPDSLGTTSNAEAMLAVTDPLDKMYFEFHQYFDSDSSGTKPPCGARPLAVPRISVATDWLKKNNRKGFLGELGGSDQQNCLDAINDALTHLEANSDVWMGWTYWSGGPRTSTAFLAIGPLGYPPIQNLQLDTLLNYVTNPLVAMVYPDLTASSCNNTPDLVIFDNTLQNGFSDYGWAASRSFNNEISFSSAGNFEGLSLGNSQKFSFMNYNAIQFDVKGASAGVSYEIYLSDGDTSPGRSQDVRGYTPSHSITTTYQTAVVPFSVFHIDNSMQFVSITFQSAEDVQDALYLDNVKLVCKDIAGGVLSGSSGSNPTAGGPPTSGSNPNSPSSSNVPSRVSSQASSLVGSVFGLILGALLLI